MGKIVQQIGNVSEKYNNGDATKCPTESACIVEPDRQQQRYQVHDDDQNYSCDIPIDGRKRHYKSEKD